MIRLLIYLATFALAYQCGRASAAECSDLPAMRDEIDGITETVREHQALADQLCAEKGNERECAQERIQLNAYKAELLRVLREYNATRRKCARGNGERHG